MLFSDKTVSKPKYFFCQLSRKGQELESSGNEGDAAGAGKGKNGRGPEQANGNDPRSDRAKEKSRSGTSREKEFGKTFVYFHVWSVLSTSKFCSCNQLSDNSTLKCS